MIQAGNLTLKQNNGAFDLIYISHVFFLTENFVYKPGDQNWFPNATEKQWSNCPGVNLTYEYHMQLLGQSLQLNNITLTYDLQSENIC